MKRFHLLLLSLIAAIAVGAQTPRYIFYFIGDGMGFGQIMSAMTYNRLALGNDSQLNMMSMPVNSLSTTFSASSPVTDSAAAGTALATGTKTRNGMLGTAPDSTAVYSVAKHLHDNGYGVAIVTTVAADDATPGAFYAHVPSRKMYYEIGRQAAESGYELIAGSALRGTTDKKTKDPTDLMAYIASQGVDVVYGTDALGNTDSRRVIMLPDVPVWTANAGYTVDAFPGAMTISALTSASIKHLMRHTPDRFFIMSEGGNIDHAGHANDGGAVVKEVLDFDGAIGLALDFYREHPDETLIVVTADHETGGMSVGSNSTGYNAFTQYFIPQKYSKERFSRLCDDLMRRDRKPTWDEMKQILAEGFGFYGDVPMSEENEARLQDVFTDTFIDGNARRQETLYAAFNQFAVEVFEILNELAGIGWTTVGHSGNPVPVFAIGVGSELFTSGNDNTQIPAKILRAAGISR